MEIEKLIERGGRENADLMKRVNMKAKGKALFVIGQQFPADDPIARFMTVLGMISDDFVHLSQLMESHPDPGTKFLILRQQVATLHEATKFIADSRRHFTEIDNLLSGLDDDAQTLLARFASWDDPKSDEYQPWRKPLRHVTAHYPVLTRDGYKAGDEKLGNALKNAAGQISGVSWDNTVELGIRYDFAGEVATAMMPPADEVSAVFVASG